ncbi:Glycoside hydrolase superfamily protein [Rutstroemia sp. NJR-2017a BBW]|nr:Glycoside hydrolase superfamily protein [Rutstroemia sp. NJR-2017a BBW]
MSITFGSVGDIIAVGQISWSLAKALNDSRGSAKEYQGLVKELRAFERAVLQIVALWQNYDCPDVITTDAVKDWLDTLRAFQEKAGKKYGASLGTSGGSGNLVKDISKKFVWMKEKEDILDLRRKLSSATDTITVSTLAAMGKSNKLAESVIAFRVQAVHAMLEDSKQRAEEQALQIKAVDEKINKQSKTLDLISIHLCEYKNEGHIAMQQLTPRGLGTGWQQDPVTLEDALGFRVPIPLELVTSWDASSAQIDFIVLS